MVNTTSSSGSKGNSGVIIAYLIGPIYLLIEKKDKTLRFHALQATFLFLALIVINVIVSTLRLWAISPLISLGATILWIILIVKGYQGNKIVLPIIGPMAEKYA